MINHIPNLISLSRIPMSAALLFVQSRPVVFWTLYLLCGLSDVLDGAIARRTGTASRLGERLDTIADIVFVAILMAIFIPAINVGGWLWIWVGLIALIKVVNVISGFAMKKGFVLTLSMRHPISVSQSSVSMRYAMLRSSCDV